MTAFKYIARVDGEIVGRRSSASQRVYTHAIVAVDAEGELYVTTWCGRLDLAKGELRKAQSLGNAGCHRIVPAERVDAYRPEATIEENK